MPSDAPTLSFATSVDLTVEQRLVLKDGVADAYRRATGTTREIGVDRVENGNDERPDR